MAAAFAANDEFDQAFRTMQLAVEKAKDQGIELDDVDHRLDSYKNSQIWVIEPKP